MKATVFACILSAVLGAGVAGIVIARTTNMAVNAKAQEIFNAAQQQAKTLCAGNREQPSAGANAREAKAAEARALAEKRTQRARRYHISKLWSKLEALTLQYPKFANPDRTQRYERAFKKDDLIAYAAFARLHGVFIETLYDDEMAGGQYKATLARYLELHRPWLCDHQHEFPHLTDACSKRKAGR